MSRVACCVLRVARCAAGARGPSARRSTASLKREEAQQARRSAVMVNTCGGSLEAWSGASNESQLGGYGRRERLLACARARVF